MTKGKLVIPLLVFCLCFTGWQVVKALQQKDIEKDYYDLGYKSVSAAKQDAETYY
ncbi:hypothetical protein [Bacillus niameyensis]|uniref:hypothetical protein n=1 Tax=Bacillus niameyensis TaxID=1522308 RepID=UPI000AE768D4|nr:hypothetical protein [Bacillus niameyensis]